MSIKYNGKDYEETYGKEGEKMKKKIKLAAFLALVIVWCILVLISSMFIGDLTRELTYATYDVSSFSSTLISISTSIVFLILTSTLGVLVFYIGFGFASDKEEEK